MSIGAEHGQYFLCEHAFQNNSSLPAGTPVMMNVINAVTS